MAKESKIVTDDVIKYGALAAAGLIGVKMIIASFGDAAATATVDGLDTLPPNENPFSPMFGPTQTKIQSNGYAGQGSETGYYQLMQQNYQFAPQLGLGYDPAVYAEKVYSSIGILFNSIDDIIAVFNQVPDGETVGEMAGYTLAIYGKDMIAHIRDGFLSFSWLKGGIGDGNIASIVNHVMSLPDIT